MDPVERDLDQYLGRQEYMSYKLDQLTEETQIKSPKQAIEILLEQLIDGKNQSYDFLVRALQVLAIDNELEDYEFIDESELKVFYRSEVIQEKERREKDWKETKDKVIGFAKKLENELYNDEDSLDTFTIDSSLNQIHWHLGQYRMSNRDIKITRKYARNDNRKVGV